MDQNNARVIPYEGEEPYIFVSYSHRDSNRVLPILRLLTDAGFRLWYDEGIDPGTEWPESIAGHLARSRVCLAFLSPSYVVSNNCRREINFALSRNLDFLSVMLEPTEMSEGMEMQISSYMSLVSYRYASGEEFFNKLCRVELLQQCRGPAAEGAERIPAAAVKQAFAPRPAAPQKKKSMVWLLIPVLVVALAAGFFLSRALSKSSPSTAAPDTTAASAAPAAAEASAASVTATTAVPEPTAAPSAETGVEEQAYEPVTLVDDSWEFGAIRITATAEKTLHVVLTDDRIPDGYTNSATPGKNEPNWDMQFVINMADRVEVIINDTADSQAPMDKMSTSVFYTMGNNFLSGEKPVYTLEGNSFVFDITFSELFPHRVDEITVFYLNLGTDTPNFSDHREFFPS